MFQAQSDSNEDLALLNQKVSYLEKALTEADLREQKAISDLKSYKQDHNTLIKEICAKQEEQLSVYSTRIFEENEKITELEKVICEKEVELDQIRQSLEESQSRIETLIKESKETEEFSKNRLEQREKYYKQEWERSIEKYENDLQHLMSQLLVAENKLKQHDNTKLHFHAESSKETAILEQKIEFLEQELKDTKRSLEEEKKHQENLLASMNSLAIGSSDEEVQIELKKMQNKHDEEVKIREEAFNLIKTELNQEICYLKQQVEDLEIFQKVSQSHKTEKDIEIAEEILTKIC